MGQPFADRKRRRGFPGFTSLARLRPSRRKKSLEAGIELSDATAVSLNQILEKVRQFIEVEIEFGTGRNSALQHKGPSVNRRSEIDMKWIIRVNTRTGKIIKQEASPEEMHWGEDSSSQNSF